MSGETFYGLREMVLPGPSQTTGYRTILVIGTTGAGKSGKGFGVMAAR